jgi:hypothetical protein
MSNWDAHKKHIFEEVKKLGIPYMIEWLDEVKHIRKHTHKNIKYGFVYNPFNDVDDELELDVYPETGKYAIILEWCVKNIPDYDFEGIPLPYGFVLPRKSVRRASAASAASAAKSAKPDETEFILKWLKDPSRDENGNHIDVSLYEGSKYYKLYNSSFTYLYELHNPEKTPLTKKLYKKIQGSLPKTHIYEFDIKDSDTGTGAIAGAIAGTIYTYDHLMMKCISERVRISDEEAVDYKFFMTEYDIFEEIFISIDRLLRYPINKTKNIKALILSYIDMYELYYLYGERMFEYVARIQLFDKKLLHLNGKTLEGTYKTIEIDKIKIKLYNFIISKSPSSMYSPDTLIGKYKTLMRRQATDDITLRNKVFASVSINNEKIVKFIKTAIYDISDLYEEAKVNVDEYLPISEDQSITAPLYPSPPRMNNDVTRYKMLMAQIKLLKSKIEESDGKKKEDYEIELEEYNKRIVVFDTPEFKAILKDYETKARLYKLDVQKYERDLKKYKKDVLGKHGKYGKYAKNSHSPTRVLPFTPVEKRAYRSLSLSKKSASQSSVKTAKIVKGSPKKTSVNHVSNCVNDNDPLTQEPFEDMSEKTLKYLSKIPTIITTADNEKKKLITCYDTVSLYNYILTCYYKNAVPDNIGMGRGSLTLDDMNQVKRKIKHFTTNKTLQPVIINKGKNSSDSKKGKKMFGKLIEIYIEPSSKILSDNIRGWHGIRLRIKIGGINFNIFDDKMAMIPTLIGDSAREDAGEIPMITMIYDELLKKQRSGNLFVTNYFPYRRGNEYILRVPDYKRMFRNDSEDILIAARNTYYNDLMLM